MTGDRPRIVVRVGGAVVGIDVDHAATADVLAVSFASLATEEAPTGRAHIVDRGDRHALMLGGVEAATSTDPATLVDHLVSWCNREAVLSLPDPVNLHAAGVVDPTTGRLVLVPGTPGAGKTTTALTAVGAGWGYLSDELVSIGHDQHAVGFAKPLTVKAGAPVERHDLSRWTTSHRQRRWYVPATAMGGHVLAWPIRPHAVVASVYQPDAEVSTVAPMPRAETLLELAVNTQDELDDAGDALLRLARVAASTVGMRLVQTHVDDAIEPLRQAAATEVVEGPSPVRSVAPAAASSQGPAPFAGVVAIDCGDGAVLHDPSSGSLLLLDHVGAVVWSLLDGTVTLDELTTDLARTFAAPTSRVGADIATLLDHLRAEGLLLP